MTLKAARDSNSTFFVQLLSLFSPAQHPDSAKLNKTGLYSTRKNVTAIRLIHNSER